MTHARRLHAVAAVALLTAAAGEARAEAPDRASCVEAYQSAQISMRRASLRAAREQLRVCLSESCATTLRADCAHWLDEVEARLPGVVLVCEGEDGRTRADVRVLVDGTPLVDRLDGRSVALDPGEHTFRFDLADGTSIEVRQVVSEGDKLQRVVARLARAGRPEVTAPAGAPAAATPRPVPWTVYALGGVGVAAAGGFAWAGLAGLSGKDDLERCKPDCASSEISSVHTKFVVADVLLGVSVVALAAATYLYLTRGTATTPSISAAF